MGAKPPIHLKAHDRLAFWHRVMCAAGGIAMAIAASIWGLWHHSWVVAILVALCIGGPVSYWLLTSVVRCPACRRMMSRLSFAEAGNPPGRTFRCNHCGQECWMREGIYWQENF
jgi:hypothetical protein